MRVKNILFLFGTLALILAGCQQPRSSSSLDEKGDPSLASAKSSKLFRYPISDRYYSGQELCILNSDITSAEKSFRVSVPLIYGHSGTPTSNTTRKFEIYAWHATGQFDPRRPTVIVLQGGPGADLHGNGPIFFDSVNEIHVDQRGVGCSRPTQAKDFWNEDFLSSEATAHDLKHILKKLGIAKATLYGISYGSIPATIAASLDPQLFPQVVLEATTNLNPNFDSSKLKKDRLQKLYDKLSLESRIFLKTHFTSPEENHFFHDLILSLNTQYFVHQNVEKLIQKFIEHPSDSQLLESIKSLKVKYFALKPGETDEKSFGNQYTESIDPLVHYNILCKEKRDPQNDYYFAPINDKIQRIARENDLCSRVQVLTPGSKKVELKKWPVKSFITYIHGEEDEATPLEAAWEHWQLVPKGESQFILARLGGHTPLSRLLLTYNLKLQLSKSSFQNFQTAGKILKSIYQSVIGGKPLNSNELDALNSETTLQWRAKFRDANGKIRDYRPIEFQIRQKKADLNLPADYLKDYQ